MSSTATKLAVDSNPRQRSLDLLVHWHSGPSWWSSLTAICSRPQLPILPTAPYFHSAGVSDSSAPKSSLSASFLLHCAVLLLVLYIPKAIPVRVQASDSRPARDEKIYYRVPILDSRQTLPRIAPAGPGARPGTGSKPERVPALGSTAAQGNLTVVSKPAVPDNSRQTIYQRSSPPDLRIPVEVKLPNMVLGDPASALKSPVKVDPNTARPLQVKHDVAPEAAPNVVPEAPKSPLVTYLDPSSTQPKLAIPVGGAAKPTARSGNGGATAAANGGVAAPGDGNDLLVVGVDPAPAGSVIALGPGNRWGDFSISPAGGQPGSPGGVPGGAAGGGAGGKGAGGDGSTGVGPGGSGGGGGNSGVAGAVSISGGGGNEARGALPSAMVAAMIHPVPAAVLAKLRKNSLVVSAGPIGGGGLGVYRALNCGKIYTVFLPMPGKNWTMQYCQKADSPQNTSAERRSAVVHMESPLVPPQPNDDSRFDFQRLPVPAEKGSKIIVLKGSLLADGTVSDLQIFQGVVPAMDEAARLAFSKWRFKPTMKDGKAIPVDILVGIPPQVPNGSDR